MLYFRACVRSRTIFFNAPENPEKLLLKAMGFCFFNNVAIAARYLQSKYPQQCSRIAIVDWVSVLGLFPAGKEEVFLWP